ncbi:MAG TPA: SURF1 family protein [Devosiaceae bacterium]|jgi:surfeit locus 1 family protein
MNTTVTKRNSRPIAFWSFIAFMAALMALFIYLGVWQLHRLGEKEALIADVTARSTLPPDPFPAVADWKTLNPADFDFRPVAITGHFVPAQTILIFTGIGEDAKGHYNGPGYWIVVPFVLQDSGTVLVNRGFVPQQLIEPYRDDANTPTGVVTLTGLARQPEASNLFTPGPNAKDRTDYVRDPQRLAAMLDPGLQPLADLYVDLPASAPNALPQGGETVIDFPNSHFEYAMTWFAFALLVPLMLSAWIWRQRHPKAKGKKG